jgi:oligo-1,6-glucosidase/alpha-glucosidase
MSWWRQTTVYQVYLRSFADGNGDGVGDIAGLMSKLDYLHSLGVETLWLSPFYSSPQADFGYDVSDYFQIAPEMGSLDDCHRLIDEVHARGMKVVFDMVLNHTSDHHHWFSESRASRSSPRRDWYIWRDGKKPGGRAPPNNWRSMIGGSGWHYDERTDQWYWASFLPFQPDLNYRNPEVKEAMLGVVRHWLGAGVDGLRLDIFNAIFKDASFKDNPRSLRLVPSEDDPSSFFQEPRHTIDHPDTLAFARELRRVVDEVPGPPRFMVGEVFGSPRALRRYCGDGDGLHLVFLFKALTTAFRADAFHALIEEVEREFADPLLPTWVFGNHDRPRFIERLGDDARKAKLVAALQLTARGVPFVYYGDEIGMSHHDVPPDQALDPIAHRFKRVPRWLRPGLRKRGMLLNRDACRRPMQWHAGEHAGFTAHEKPWLPAHPHSSAVNVAAQHADPGSLLSTYRRLLSLRRENATLHSGRLALVDRASLPRSVLGYRREHDGAHAHVRLNFSDRPARVDLRDAPHAAIHSNLRDDARSAAQSYELEPYEAIVLTGWVAGR